MFLFNPNKGVSFIKQIGGGALAWVGAVQGFEWLWSKFGITSPQIIWAYTISTFFFIIYLAMFVCFTRQAVYQQRLDECADAKRKLEEQLLKNRQSSKKKK